MSLILVLLFTSCSNLKDKNAFYHPADFDPVNNILDKYNSNINNISLVKLKNKPVSDWIRDLVPVYLFNGNGEMKLVFMYLLMLTAIKTID